MDGKKIALLVGALVIAVITALMARSLMSGTTAPTAQAAAVPDDSPQVLVATKALPIGTIVEQDAFRYQPWPKELMQSAYFVKGGEGSDPQQLVGRVIRYAVTAGQPLTQGALVKPGDRGFLAAALGPGMRAVTVFRLRRCWRSEKVRVGLFVRAVPPTSSSPSTTPSKLIASSISGKAAEISSPERE